MTPHPTTDLCYEFGDFVLDPLRRTLLHNNEARSLRPKAFQLLLVMVENHGQTFTRQRLVEAVWGNALVAEINFDVTLSAVRKALGESARKPGYIIKNPDGYCFLGEVREVGRMNQAGEPAGVRADSQNTESEDAISSARSAHTVHIWVSSCIYAGLYTAALVLEVAYQLDQFSAMVLRIAPITFVWITISSVAALTADRKLTFNGKTTGLTVSATIFLMAAALLFIVLRRYLPPEQITQSTIQSYPAQAAYLKDVSYFLALAFCFLIVPFHFIAAAEKELGPERHWQILELLNGDKLTAAPKGTFYPRFWALAVLLVVLAAISLVMTSHLLDHLRQGPYTNLFTQLVYVRAILYFGLGIECLIWYRRSIDELKRQCLD